MADKHTLAFEIGVEEIPAFDLDSANKQLEKMVPAAFADARIPYDSIEIHSSPRRLIVMAYGVADATEALVEEYKGPAAKIAFDADGNPTKVGQTLEAEVTDKVAGIVLVKAPGRVPDPLLRVPEGEGQHFGIGADQLRVGGAGEQGAHPIRLQRDEKKTFGQKLHDVNPPICFCPV